MKVDIWTRIVFYCNGQDLFPVTFAYNKIGNELCLLDTYNFYLPVNGLSIIDIGLTRYYAVIT